MLISQFLLLLFLILLHSSSHLLTHDYHDKREMDITDCQIIILTTTSGSWLWQNSNIHLIWLNLVIISKHLFRMYLSQTNIGHHTLLLLDQSEASDHPDWPIRAKDYVSLLLIIYWSHLLSCLNETHNLRVQVTLSSCVCDKFIWLQAKHLSNMNPRLPNYFYEKNKTKFIV